MAQFYPGCRQCPHRDDTGTLSTRQVEQLAETRSRGGAGSPFHDEGVGGVYLNDLTPVIAREIAAALGVSLQCHTDELPCRSGGTSLRHESLRHESLTYEGRGDTTEATPFVPQGRANQSAPVVVLGGDGRPLTGPMVAAVGEGLRFAGCQVVDIGPTTSPCMAFSIDRLGASGGILIGNPNGATHTVGLKFWTDGPHPISAGRRLDAIRRAYEAGTDRPTRDYGALRRLQADELYLATLAEYYHGLRPLRVVLSTSSRPTTGHLAKLAEQVACRILPGRTARERLGDQVRADEAHLGCILDDDGETCHVLDEAGRPVPPERLLLLVARHLTQGRADATLVVEDGTDGPYVDAIRTDGLRMVSGGPARADMHQAMHRHDALLGGGRSGRFWYTHTGTPLPDSLTTLSLLLVILSQSDHRLSEVLDRQANVE